MRNGHPNLRLLRLILLALIVPEAFILGHDLAVVGPHPRGQGLLHRLYVLDSCRGRLGGQVLLLFLSVDTSFRRLKPERAFWFLSAARRLTASSPPP